MITTKSYSNDSRFLSAYISALKSQFPFAIVSGIVFLVLFLVMYFATTVNNFDPVYAQEFFKEYYGQGIYADKVQSGAAFVFLAIMIFVSTLSGMSYLHRKNTVDLYHSLPVTRPQLLTANLLSSMTAVVCPFIIMQLLTMIIQLISCAKYDCFGSSYFLFIFLDIAGAIVYTAVVASFTAFIAVSVGTIFDSFSAAAVIGFTPPAVYLISGTVWQSLVYGAYFEPSENTLCLSPFLFIYKRYYYFNGAIIDYTRNAWLLLLGIIMTAVFFILALVCYRRRKSEIAEQTQPRGVLQTIVRFVAVFIGGATFYAILNGKEFIMRLTVMFIGAVSAGIIAELILSRGVKWLVKNIKLIVGASVVYCLLVVMVQADTFGYASRLPAADSIAAVKISYGGRFEQTDSFPSDYYNGTDMRWLDSAESISVVRDVHSVVLENRPTDSYDGSDKFNYLMLNIEYKLKNGTTMKRIYNPIHSLAGHELVKLEANDDFIRANSALFWVQSRPDMAQVETVELYASFEGINGNHANVIAAPEVLLDAMRADMLEQSLEDIINPQEPSLGVIRINFKAVPRKDGYGYEKAIASVIVTREYKRTIEVLKRLDLDGGFDDAPLNIDKVLRVGIIPAEAYSYSLNRVTVFSQTFFNTHDSMPWDINRKYSEDNPYGSILTTNDAISIKALASASRDILFEIDRQDWQENYAVAFFEFADGSYSMKAVKLSGLPEDILSEVRAAAE